MKSRVITVSNDDGIAIGYGGPLSRECRSEGFCHFWTFQDVLEREGGVRVFLHPSHGRVTFE